MREIKFRAWDKACECYLYDVQGAYDTLSGCVKDENGEDAGYDEECFAGFLDNDKYVVEQFTGLRDKNGREVYEGDIVKNEYGDVDVVQYGTQDHEEDYGDRFVYQGWNIQIGSGYPDAVMIEYTVIGNIYENPELMEVSEHE